jgi:hypothetical protein
VFIVGNTYRSDGVEPFDQTPFLRAVAAFWLPSKLKITFAGQSMAENGNYTVSLEQLAFCCIMLEQRIFGVQFQNASTVQIDMFDMISRLVLECSTSPVHWPKVLGINIDCEIEALEVPEVLLIDDD